MTARPSTCTTLTSATDPAMYVEPPPTPRGGRTFPLSKTEAGQVREGARTLAETRPDAAAAVAMLAGLGTRSGSLLTLTWATSARSSTSTASGI
ncbi:hypothetical protein [Nonomuraea sp. NPDC003709]|uniref:hypothetical protein n=1 Tax=Nonomuraea sp. NPDC003709 TaxID=3154450 RepID=UPI0033A9BB2A